MSAFTAVRVTAMADAMVQKEKSGLDSSPTSTKRSSRKHDDDQKKGRKNDKKEITPKGSSVKKSDTRVCAEVGVGEATPRPSGSKDTTDSVSMNDIMNCLNTIRNEQSRYNNRLDELSSKVNELYEYEENELLGVYDDDNVSHNVAQNSNDPGEIATANNGKRADKGTVDDSTTGTDNNNNEEPPSKKQKTDDQSVFKSMNDKFKIKEKTDAPVDSELAELVNNLFRQGMPEDQFSELIKSINRPENCDSLTKTRVNQLIWNLLTEPTRAEENRLQYKQNMLIKAACLITKMLHELNVLRNEKEVDIPEDIMCLGTDALGLLGHCNKVTNMHRREMHRPDLNYQYQHLASSSAPFTSLLYGDDVSKNVSDIDSANKVGNKIRRLKFGHGYGGWPRGYKRGRGRGGPRGRGRGLGFRRRGRGRGMHLSSYNQSNQDQSDNEIYDPKNYKTWHHKPKRM